MRRTHTDVMSVAGAMPVTPQFPRSRPSLARGLAATLIIGVVFFVSAHLGSFWTTAGRTASPIFPGTGGALTLLLLIGRQYWPAIVIGRLLAFWAAATGRPFWLLVAVAGANALTAWIGAYVLERWGRLDVALSRLRDVLWLALAGGLGSSVVGATIGVTAMFAAGEVTPDDFWAIWLRWWMGSLSGVLVITPLLLAWGAGEPWPRSPGYWLHLSACVLATCLVSSLLFFGSQFALAHTWLVYPVLLWSSLAFGVRGATLALLPMTVIGVAGAAMGTGFLGWMVAPGVRYVLLQQFVTAASLTCLLLAVVADERRGKKALRDREHRLHLALAAARSFGFDYDTATDTVTRTAECAEILGLPPESAERGTSGDFFRRVHEDDRSRLEDTLRHLTPATRTIRETYRFVRDDGTIVYLDETATGEFDGHGRLTRLVGVTVDVTARLEAEAEREQLLERERRARLEAEQATLLRDEFLGTVSHELRTPLNAILGWAQILQSGPRSDDALQSGLATIARNARLQAQLIEDLLDLSRMSAGQLRIDAAPIDLAGVVAEAVQALTPAAAAKGLSLEQELAGPAMVSGDAERLQQVCWNLLMNAVKFTPAGGGIVVRVDSVDGMHRLRVRDTGEGISDDFLPYVFDRFRQADGSTTRRHSGLGIGLALVRRLVELHGGTVRADSDGPGLGATFTVELPRLETGTRSSTATDGPSGMPPSTPPGAPTVLVVDDDADAREVAARMLDGACARVLVAATATEGLELLRRERPDVIVADVGMPDVDGYAFIRAVRQLPAGQGADTPAAAVTALAREEDRRRALDAGFQSHLAKPVTREALLAVVTRLSRPRTPR